ncbi:uncharacterized protein LOC124200349 [Daphnia pulex]|uniref:uncharacterized protein LOC124200349 n=1 Tax=Daphnia pulex TaxID=6669 RepID=UPI001EDD4AB9|nr:uncharacterized protein LOC124200349 [Daphnia pulex]
MPTKSLADLIISRLHVEKMEGGVVVAGRSFRTASQCPTLILLFSGCFTVAGVVLTVLVYRPLTYTNTHYLQHLTGSQIGGPILVVVGLLFLAVGLALHIVSQRLKFPSDQAQLETDAAPATSTTTISTTSTTKSPLGRLKEYRCCWKIPWKWVRKSTKTISVRKKKVVTDLLASTEYVCMIERSYSSNSYYESYDVASFPGTYCYSIDRSLRSGGSSSSINSPVQLKTRL